MASWVDVHIIERGDFVEDANGARTSVTYYAESSTDATQDQALLASAGGVTVPVPGASYSVARPSCVVRQRTVEFINARQFRVKCDYEDKTDGSDEAGLLAKPAVYSGSNEAESESYAIDATGAKVVNTAGEVFDNAPTRQKGVKTYTVKKYLDAAGVAALAPVWNSNNDAAVTIRGTEWAADELWMSGLDFEDVEGSPGVQQATMVIKGKKGGWKDEPLNVGFRDKDGYVIMMEKQWNNPADHSKGYTLIACSKPWPLGSDGYAKTGSPPAVDSLTFWPYGEANWSGVPLV